jgi:hypothetical protein
MTCCIVEATDLTSANPKTKDDFIKLAQSVAATIFERLHDKPLYSAFAEEIARQAVAPLKDVDTRKIGSAITAVASEKTKMAKDQASGKKKVGYCSNWDYKNCWLMGLIFPIGRQEACSRCYQENQRVSHRTRASSLDF